MKSSRPRHGFRSGAQCADARRLLFGRGGLSRRVLLQHAAFIQGAIMCHLAYYMSLQGGTLDWLHENMGWLLGYCLASVIGCAALTLYLWLGPPRIGFLIRLQPPPTLSGRAALLAVLWIPMFCMFIMDRDAEVWSHGGYNSLGFFVFFMLVMATFWIQWLGHRFLSKRVWIGANVVVLLIVVLPAIPNLIHGYSVWRHGVGGVALQRGGACPVSTPLFTLEDASPLRSNFWAGPQTCPQQPSMGHWDEEGKLRLEKGVTWRPWPRSENWSFAARVEPDQSIQGISLKSLGEPRGADEPVPAETEALLLEKPHSDSHGIAMRCVRNETAWKRAHTMAAKRKGSAPPNILIIYIDAVSRRHFHRKLPLTVRLLEERQAAGQTNVLEAFKYMDVAPNTLPNTRCMFAACAYDTPVFWEAWQSLGYVHAWISNSCEDWAAKAVNRSVVYDHQFAAPFCHPDFYPPGYHHGLARGPFAVTRRCLYGDHTHQWVFKYAEEYWKQYADVPRAAMLNFNDGHELTGEVVELMDTAIVDFLERMDVWDDTVIMFMSDHGLHMGPTWALGAPSTKKENAMPLWIQCMPPSWVESHPKAWAHAQANMQKLIWSGDMYVSLLDLALRGTVDERKEDNVSAATLLPRLREHISVPPTMPTGDNVFLSMWDALPDDRDCSHIPRLHHSAHCMCNK